MISTYKIFSLAGVLLACLCISEAGHYAPQYAYPKYAYSYGVNDGHTGDKKTHSESRDGDVVTGQYTIADPDGTTRTVQYTADKGGFRAHVLRAGTPVYPPAGKGGWAPAPAAHGGWAAPAAKSGWAQGAPAPTHAPSMAWPAPGHGAGWSAPAAQGGWAPAAQAGWAPAPAAQAGWAPAPAAQAGWAPAAAKGDGGWSPAGGSPAAPSSYAASLGYGHGFAKVSLN